MSFAVVLQQHMRKNVRNVNSIRRLHTNSIPALYHLRIMNVPE